MRRNRPQRNPRSDLQCCRGLAARKGAILSIQIGGELSSGRGEKTLQQALVFRDHQADPGRTLRLDSLTGLRALAAFDVFAHHSVFIVFHSTGWGTIGVTFFFVLSGFVLTWSHSRRDTAAAFYQRRFARIYPAYFASLVTALALSGYLHIGTDSYHVASTFLLIQSWIPHSSYYFAVNGVAWTLACEAFFYLCFPLFIRPLLSVDRKMRRILECTLLAIVLGLGILETVESGHPTLGWLVQHAPFVAIAEFILGSLVAIDVMAGTWPRFRWSVGCLFGLAAFLTGPIAYLIAGSRSVNLTNIALPLLPLLFFIAAAAHADIDRRGTIFSRRLAVRLGQISYCFYLFHQLVIETVAKALRGMGHVPLIILVFVASLAVAWLVHVVVEQPCERWLRGSSRPTPPVSVQS